MRVNRRNFMRSGLVGAAGLVLSRQEVVASGKERVTERTFIKRKLGKTGIELPVVSMGVMRADNPALVKRALAEGIVHLDTANGYQRGRNEEMLGELLKDYPRSSFVIATKVKPAGADRRTGIPGKETTAKAFLADFETSMERLGMEYVDILYFHAVQAVEMLRHKGIVKAMKKLKKEGRVKHIGVSTHANEVEIIKAMIEDGFWDVVLVRYNFALDYLNDLDRVLEQAHQKGMGIVAMKTMAGLFLDDEKQHPVNTRAALKWALQKPYIHTSIPGFTAFEHLEESLMVAEDLKMTAEEKNSLHIPDNMTGLMCNSCRQCVDQCPVSLPVPDLMRAYMYTYGYAETVKAKTLLAELEVGTNPCGDCSECMIACQKGFDLKQRISRLAPLVDVPEEYLI